MLGSRSSSYFGLLTVLGCISTANMVSAQVAPVSLIDCGPGNAFCQELTLNNTIGSEINTNIVPAINANIANIATNTADIATNTANTATNTADIATNTADIATNTANIAALVSSVGGASSAGIARNAAAIADLRSDMSQGLAVANAMNVFLPDPGKNFAMSVGMGYYDDASAIGVTGSGRIDGSTSYFFGVGSAGSGDTTGAKAGLVFQW